MKKLVLGEDMNLRHHLGIAIAALFLTVFISVGAQASPYTGLVVFGDSLSDTGNNALVFDAAGLPLPPGSLRTPTPIASPTFIPTYPYASNRYSNGPAWVDAFAASLGLSATPSLVGGTNFAFGGARTGPIGSAFPYSLLDQTSFFLAATGGIAPESNLYVVQGGGNDARDIFALAAGGGDPTALIVQFALNVSLIVSELNAAGATDLLLVNVPDIGKTPAIQSLGPAAAGLATALTATMNTALDATIASLTVAPNTHLFELDAFGLVNNVITNPADFGMTDVTSACAANAACIASPASTFFWDGIHPTTAGHMLIAQTALQAVPEPTTMLLLGLGLMGLVGFRKNLRRK